jgi:hypothetical protein
VGLAGGDDLETVRHPEDIEVRTPCHGAVTAANCATSAACLNLHFGIFQVAFSPSKPSVNLLLAQVRARYHGDYYEHQPSGAVTV